MTKKITSSFKYVFLVFAITLFISSCTDDNSVLETPTGEGNGETPDPDVATIIFNQNEPTKNKDNAAANGTVGTTVPGRVIFTTTETKQKRMYVTQNISGQGEMPFNAFDLVSDDLKKLLKADGSIDLDKASTNEIDFTFALPVPNIDNGEIVYKFWTTSGKGDFRDATKRLALGIGTIKVTVGNGTNPAAEVRKFTGIKLFAPAADGSTKTFFSLLNETVYKVNEGPEFRAFWDFGYYYGASGISADDNASFASTATYETSFGENFEVTGLKPGADEENADTETLNNMFFALSDLDAAAFDEIMLSGGLDNITQLDGEKITNLSVGDVIAFEDNYEKKGYIKITEIKAGYNNNDYIEFDVKIQP